MIDITELAQSLKAAAEKVTALNLDTAQEVRDEDGYLECPVCGGEGSVDSERDYCNIDGVALGIQFYGIGEHHGLAEQYFRIATPSNILSLIEALEKAQAKADVYDMLRDDYGLREKGVGLADFVDWQAKRIAALESRTVKLPKRHSMLLREDFNEDYHTEMAYKADEVHASLAAAGIKVEAE